MAISLDQQIQTKMDAYRGDPNKLMQRYQQSQELLDLLALQKLKSEKEAAARDMQMQMQQNPNTIKQQREAELVGMTKKELIDQTGGILALNKARQQCNLRKAMAQGVPSRPAPNMRSLADGGIVGFQPGGEVLDRLIEEKIAEIQADPNLSNTEKQEAIAKLRAPKVMGPKSLARDVLGDEDGMIRKLIADQQYDDEVMGLGMGASKGDTIPLSPGTYSTALTNKLQSKTPIGQLMKRNIAGLASQIGGPEIDLRPDAMAIGVGNIPPDRKGGDSVIEGIPGITMDDDKKTEEESKVTAPESGIKGITAPTVKYDSPLEKIRAEVKRLKKDDPTYELQDIDAVRKKGRKEFQDATKDIIPDLEEVQKDKQTGLESLIAGKEKFYEDIQDPDVLRNRQLRAALAGAAGKGSFGETLAGVTQASLAEEKAQEQFKVKGFQDVFNNKKSLIDAIGKDKADIIGKSFEITKGAFEIGEKRGKTAAIENAAAKTAAAKLDSAVLNAVSKDAEMFFKQDVTNADFKQKANIAHAKLMSAAADREVKVDIANLQATLGAQKNALLAEANKIKSATSLRDFRTKLFTGTQKIIVDLKSKYQKIYLPLIEDAKLAPNGEKRAKDLLKQMNGFIAADTASLQAVTEGIIKDLEENIGGGGKKSSNVTKALSIAKGSI